jgi:hypothetical protein
VSVQKEGSEGVQRHCDVGYVNLRIRGGSMGCLYDLVKSSHSMSNEKSRRPRKKEKAKEEERTLRSAQMSRAGAEH